MSIPSASCPLTNEQLLQSIAYGEKLLNEGWLSTEALEALESMAQLVPDPILSPREFRARLLIDAAGSLRPLEDSLDSWQREDYEAADRGWLRMVTGQGDGKLRYYFERPKGHDKTTGMAHMAGWAMHVCQRPLEGVAAASTQDQAKKLRDAIDKMVRRNPWLAESLRVNNYEVVNRRTGSKLTIITSDAGSNQGANPDFVIIDELTVWKKQDLWDALISAAGKKANGIVVVISNAGYGMGTSWQWAIREECRTNEARWHFRRLEKIVASWINQAAVEEDAKTMTPLERRRVWGNDWTVESGDCLLMSDIEACVFSGAMPLFERDGKLDFYVAGLDLSLTRNHTAFVIVATDPARNRVRLVHVKNWNPQDFGGTLDLTNQVENYVFEACKRFKVESLHADHWNPQLLQNISNRMKRVPGMDGFSAWGRFPSASWQKEMAHTIVNIFKQRRFEMWRDPMLFQDLLKLNIVDAGGYVKLDPPEDENGHCDRAMALAQCLPIAVKVLDATRHDLEKPAA